MVTTLPNELIKKILEYCNITSLHILNKMSEFNCHRKTINTLIKKDTENNIRYWDSIYRNILKKQLQQTIENYIIVIYDNYLNLDYEMLELVNNSLNNDIFLKKILAKKKINIDKILYKKNIVYFLFDNILGEHNFYTKLYNYNYIHL